MFAPLHLDINSLKSRLFHLTGRANFQKGRITKVKNGIISETKFLTTISVDQYRSCPAVVSQCIWAFVTSRHVRLTLVFKDSCHFCKNLFVRPHCDTKKSQSVGSFRVGLSFSSKARAYPSGAPVQDLHANVRPN